MGIDQTGALYTGEFYSRVGPGGRRSAERILPYVLELVHPRSIVDVGCGSGEWLSAALDLGVTDVLGLDGPHAGGHLVIPRELFRATDISDGLQLDRTFDLALCIEVAEHLAPSRAGQLVGDLVRLAPVVMFGGAIPGQGGVGHLNEQWLDYWNDLFAARGCVMVDCIRRRFWDDPGVAIHACQNLVVFARRDRLDGDQLLVSAHDPLPMRVVHPELFRLRLRATPPGLGWLLRQLPAGLIRTLRFRLKQGRRSPQGLA